MIDPTKKEKLLQIREQLLDVYIEEANPENWTTEEIAREQAAGADSVKEGAKIVAEWKGQRYWEKKNANQTMTMLLTLDRFLQEETPAEEEESDEKAKKKEMKRFENEAKARLARSRPKLVVNNEK